MSMYKLEWRWWWNSEGEDANLWHRHFRNLLLKEQLKLSMAKGNWQFRINYPEWGRYFVKAYDPVSGHSTGKVVYIDWPGWAGRAERRKPGSHHACFSSEKPTYAIGEKQLWLFPEVSKAAHW